MRIGGGNRLRSVVVTRVRPARQDDVDELVRLLGLLFEGESEFSAEPSRQRAGLRSLLATAGPATVLVAERDDRVLGLVTLQLVVSTAEGGRAALLEDLVVDPTARGAGIGSMLVAAAVDHAANLDCCRVTLVTDAENVDAQRLYERHGFVRSTMLTMRRPVAPGDAPG